jgi:hypothetical protein
MQIPLDDIIFQLKWGDIVIWDGCFYLNSTIFTFKKNMGVYLIFKTQTQPYVYLTEFT